MKKSLVIFLCIVMLFSMSACRKTNTGVESALSSDTYSDESLIATESQPELSSTDTDVNNISSNDNTATNNTTTSSIEVNSDIGDGLNTSETPDTKEKSYNDIVCTKIYNFRQVGFSINGSNTMLFVPIPQEWKLEKSNNGYSISRNSQVIGNVANSEKTTSTNGSVNVFYGEMNIDDIKVTHSIDQINSDNQPSYIRTLCYNYDDGYGNRNSIFITSPYQEMDSSAAYKMITEIKTSVFSTKSNLGVLKIQDSRNKVLILGNSFIGSSSIGSILQTMCGDEMTVEAYARGYAHVGTYTNDANMMQKIRDGNYSAVFICGLYDQEAVLDLEDIINTCKESNTKLAIFPAHNENRSAIDSAISKYPDTILLDWKAEVDNLIATGINVSHFCIPDAHNHSTPLAGYVGAHMIYRAIFNKIPQSTQFTEVSESQINLLGDYVTSGLITLLDENSAYILD